MPTLYHFKGTFNRDPGRWTKEVLEKAIGEFQSVIQANKAFGGLGDWGAVDSACVNLDRVSHLITELHADGDSYSGTVRVLNTPMGAVLRTVIDDGCELVGNLCGMGTISDSGEVGPDFRIISMSLVPK